MLPFELELFLLSAPLPADEPRTHTPEQAERLPITYIDNQGNKQHYQRKHTDERNDVLELLAALHRDSKQNEQPIKHPGQYIPQLGNKHNALETYLNQEKPLDLSGLNLEGINLNNICFPDETKVTNTNFRKANLENLKMEKATIENADFTDAHLTRAKLGSSKIVSSRFDNANLTQIDAVGCSVERSSFDNSTLDNAGLYTIGDKRTYMTFCSFEKASMQGCRVKGSYMEHNNFHQSDWTDAEVSNSQTMRGQRTFVENCNFTGANLTNVSLREVSTS